MGRMACLDPKHFGPDQKKIAGVEILFRVEQIYELLL